MARPPTHSSGATRTHHVNLAPGHAAILEQLLRAWRMSSKSAVVRRALELCKESLDKKRRVAS